jgi:hypothetical protein
MVVYNFPYPFIHCCDVHLCHPYGILFRRFITATSVASLAGLVLVSGVLCHLSHRDSTLVEKWCSCIFESL